MNICVVRSDNKAYLCNSELEHKKGDKVMWKCGEENGWGEVTVGTFKMCPYDCGGFERAGHPIGEILGKFVPTSTYVRDIDGGEPKRRFKIWCETRKDRDDALAELSCEGVYPKQPFDPILLNIEPVGLMVSGNVVTIWKGKEDFDEVEVPQYKLDEDKLFWVDA